MAVTLALRVRKGRTSWVETGTRLSYDERHGFLWLRKSVHTSPRRRPIVEWDERCPTGTVLEWIHHDTHTEALVAFSDGVLERVHLDQLKALIEEKEA